MGNLEYNKKREMDDNGYVPFFHTMQYERIDTLQSAILPADEHKIDALSDIISVCQQKNIDLIFVFSPIWLIIEDNLRDTIIPNLCSQNGMTYLNMSDDSTFINNPEYFSDRNHLNDVGARVFSSLLIEKIIEADIY